MNKDRLQAIYSSLERFKDRDSRDLPPKVIYILDDDFESCKLMRSLCKRFIGMDTSVEIFQEEISLLRRSKERHPDLVILDYHLDCLKGPDVLKMLNAISLFKVKSLLISGDSNLKEYDNLFTKPISLKRFERELCKAVA